MNEAKLKKMLVPLIKECVKECIQEIILEGGLLKKVVTEVAQGMNVNNIMNEQRYIQAPYYPPPPPVAYPQYVQPHPNQTYEKTHQILERSRNFRGHKNSHITEGFEQTYPTPIPQTSGNSVYDKYMQQMNKPPEERKTMKQIQEERESRRQAAAANMLKAASGESRDPSDPGLDMSIIANMMRGKI